MRDLQPGSARSRAGRQYENRVAVLGLAGRDDVGPMRAFVDQYALGSFPHGIDRDGSLWAHVGVRAQPAWVFVGPDGTTERAFGALSEPELRAHLDGPSG